MNLPLDPFDYPKNLQDTLTASIDDVIFGRQNQSWLPMQQSLNLTATWLASILDRFASLERGYVDFVVQGMDRWERSGSQWRGLEMDIEGGWNKRREDLERVLLGNTTDNAVETMTRLEQLVVSIQTWCKTRLQMLRIHSEFQLDKRQFKSRIPSQESLDMTTKITGNGLELSLLTCYVRLLLNIAQFDFLQSSIEVYQSHKLLKLAKIEFGPLKQDLLALYTRYLSEATDLSRLFFQRSIHSSVTSPIPSNHLTRLKSLNPLNPILSCLLLALSHAKIDLQAWPGQSYEVEKEQHAIPTGLQSYPWLAGISKNPNQISTLVSLELPTILSILHLREGMSDQEWIEMTESHMPKSITSPNLASHAKGRSVSRGFLSALGFSQEKPVKKLPVITPTKTIVYHDKKLDKTYVIHPMDLFPTTSSHLHRLLGVVIFPETLSRNHKEDVISFWTKFEQAIQ